MHQPEPTWSPEAHLDRVYRRGHQLRRRRRAALASVPTAAIVVLGVLIAANSVSPSTTPVRVAQGGIHSTTTSGESGQDQGVNQQAGAPGTPENGTSSSHAAAGEASGSPSSPNSSVPGGTGAGQPGTNAATPAAAVGPGTGQKGSPNRGGGSQAPANGAAPTSTGAPPCSSSALVYSTATDHTKYARGETVAVFLVVRNRSSEPCQGPGRCGIQPWASVSNAAGTVVWQSHPIAITCVNPPPQPPLIQPGQSASYPAGQWDQQVCATSSACSGQAPPGTYRAVAHRGDVTATGTRFSIS